MLGQSEISFTRFQFIRKHQLDLIVDRNNLDAVPRSLGSRQHKNPKQTVLYRFPKSKIAIDGTTIFRTTQRCNSGTMLQPFETMSQQ